MVLGIPRRRSNLLGWLGRDRSDLLRAVSSPKGRRDAETPRIVLVYPTLYRVVIVFVALAGVREGWALVNVLDSSARVSD